MSLAALRTNSGSFLCNDYLAALVAVVGRDTMSPPELTADTPVSDIVGPVKVGLFHTLRNQLDLAIFYSLYCGLNQLLHLYKPLLFYKRLDGGLTTVMGTYVVAVVLNLYKQALSV